MNKDYKFSRDGGWVNLYTAGSTVGGFVCVLTLYDGVGGRIIYNPHGSNFTVDEEDVKGEFLSYIDALISDLQDVRSQMEQDEFGV